MGSSLLKNLGLPAIGLGVLFAVACDSGEDGVIFGATATPAPSIYIRTTGPSPTPAPQPADRPTLNVVTAAPAPQQTSVSLDWLSSNAEVPALPSPFAHPVPAIVLQGAIESALEDFDGEYSVVVHNLKDGRYAAFNDSEVYYGASLYKLALLYEAYRQRDAGLLDFSMEVELTKEYTQHDLGSLEYLELQTGDLITIEDAVSAMTIVSDTSTAVLIQELIGWQADQTLLDLGLTDTQFLNSDLPATARDMARLMTAIASGEGVSNESRLAMLGLLGQEWFSSGIVADSDAPVAHKTGSYTDATHDVAVVWGPAGPYILAVMTDASGDFGPVREVAEAVYEYFEATS